MNISLTRLEVEGASACLEGALSKDDLRGLSDLSKVVLEANIVLIDLKGSIQHQIDTLKTIHTGV